jgi:hypothetical protein
MENKQTAVEWLVQQLNEIKFYTEEARESTINHALAMEKGQHFESYRRGNSFLDANTLDFEGYFEEYYKETYGK